MTSTTLTELETKLLQNILTNDYGDIGARDIWAWAWSAGCHGKFCSNAAISGVVASLSKKEILTSTGETGNDANMSLTKKGEELVISLGWEYVKGDDGKYRRAAEFAPGR